MIPPGAKVDEYSVTLVQQFGVALSANFDDYLLTSVLKSIKQFALLDEADSVAGIYHEILPPPLLPPLPAPSPALPPTPACANYTEGNTSGSSNCSNSDVGNYRERPATSARSSSQMSNGMSRHLLVRGSGASRKIRSAGLTSRVRRLESASSSCTSPSDSTANTSLAVYAVTSGDCSGLTTDRRYDLHPGTATAPLLLTALARLL